MLPARVSCHAVFRLQPLFQCFCKKCQTFVRTLSSLIQPARLYSLLMPARFYIIGFPLTRLGFLLSMR